MRNLCYRAKMAELRICYRRTVLCKWKVSGDFTVGNGFSLSRRFPRSSLHSQPTLCFPTFQSPRASVSCLNIIIDCSEECIFNPSIVLNQREREIIVHRLKADAGPATETEFSWVELRAAVLDWKVYLHAAIYICTSIPLYSLSLFLPSIVQGMGFTNLRAQAMTAPPYAIGMYSVQLSVK